MFLRFRQGHVIYYQGHLFIHKHYKVYEFCLSRDYYVRFSKAWLVQADFRILSVVIANYIPIIKAVTVFSKAISQSSKSVCFSHAINMHLVMELWLYCMLSYYYFSKAFINSVNISQLNIIIIIAGILVVKVNYNTFISRVFCDKLDIIQVFTGSSFGVIIYFIIIKISLGIHLVVRVGRRCFVVFTSTIRSVFFKEWFQPSSENIPIFRRNISM